jgi:hypothetical protein
VTKESAIFLERLLARMKPDARVGAEFEELNIVIPLLIF